MNTLRKSMLAMAVGATLLSGSVAAEGLSANMGVTSDYFFRGIDQGSAATGSAGLDYDFGNGLSVGTWAADVTDGIEYDLYGAYGGEVSDFTYSVGFTGYFYTGEFDDTYQEINLGAGWGPISVEYSIGTWNGFGTEADYTFAAITAEHNGMYATYGTFGEDFEGTYLELGYGTTIAEGTDIGFALINSDEDLSNQVDADGDPTSETSLTVSISKSFDI
jgi:uncharacterized protein (TIGR02001 family)